LSSRFERADENGFAADDGTSLETGAVLDSATDQGGPEVLEKTALPFELVFLAAAGVIFAFFQHFQGLSSSFCRVYKQPLCIESFARNWGGQKKRACG
jgi:hypothetical protein